MHCHRFEEKHPSGFSELINNLPFSEQCIQMNEEMDTAALVIFHVFLYCELSLSETCEE